MSKRITESLVKVHLTHTHVGCYMYKTKDTVLYNFTVHFKHKYHLVILQSAWYLHMSPCIIDAILILEALNIEVKNNWAVLFEESTVIAYLINEINAKYISKIARREDFRRGMFLSPLVSNGRDSLTRKLQKLALKKAQVSKLNRETYDRHYRTWEKFDFEIDGGGDS